MAALKKLLFSRSSVSEFGEAFKQINEIYKAFILKRFRKFSGGGGNWARLAPSTIRRKGHSAILRDTDLMVSKLDPHIKNTEGILTPSARAGLNIVSGIEGNYPKGTPVDDVFEIHDKGKGRMKKRQILVGMDEETAEKVARVADTATQAYLKRAKR